MSTSVEWRPSPAVEWLERDYDKTMELDCLPDGVRELGSSLMAVGVPFDEVVQPMIRLKSLEVGLGFEGLRVWRNEGDPFRHD